LLSGESELTRLDSSIKKNSAFIKKLKLLTADNGKQLLAEAAKLNLSKVGVNKVVPTRTAAAAAAMLPSHSSIGGRLQCGSRSRQLSCSVQAAHMQLFAGNIWHGRWQLTVSPTELCIHHQHTTNQLLCCMHGLSALMQDVIAVLLIDIKTPYCSPCIIAALITLHLARSMSVRLCQRWQRCR
jgi:hypothetical protein